jgi:putative transposase
VWNWGLAEWNRQYEAGEKPSAYALNKQFNAEKDEIAPWIRSLPYTIVGATFIDLGNAWRHFFRRVKDNSAKKKGSPRFKKRGMKSSFAIKNYTVEHSGVKVPKKLGGFIRFKEKGYAPVGLEYGSGGAVYAAISERAGRWFISFQADQPDITPTNGTQAIGVDVGISSLATVSDGIVFENPRALAKYQRQLARAQRELSRRKKGSRNREKTKKKIARLHARIANVRGHAAHQVSHYVAYEADAASIGVEDLNVAGMVKNRHLSRALSDAGMGELLRQIKYKADWASVEVIEAGRFYPSSKTCSECGHVVDNLKLSDRVFVCPVCGLRIGRDLNAARNLAAYREPPNGRGLPVELE